MRLRNVAAAALTLSALTLSGCVTEQVESADTTIQQKLDKLCPQLNGAHLAFTVLALVFHVPANVSEAEKAAYAGAQTLCANPSAVTIENAPQEVQDAIDAVNKARSQTGR